MPPLRTQSIALNTTVSKKEVLPIQLPHQTSMDVITIPADTYSHTLLYYHQHKAFHYLIYVLTAQQNIGSYQFRL